MTQPFLPPFPTWIEIDLSAIEHNTHRIAAEVKAPLLAVVKDNGYGHGAVQVAQAFLRAGGTWLGVARCHEGIELRQGGITAPVLVFGGILPEESDLAIRNGLTVALYSQDMVEVLSGRARALGKEARVHIKIDTGMGRFGVFPHQAASLAQAAARQGIVVDGIFSHLSSAGDDEPLTNLQIERFHQAVAALEQTGIVPRWVHMSNSSSIFAGTPFCGNLARAGGILYGLNVGYPDSPLFHDLQQAFAWKARLMSVKRMPLDWTISYNANYATRENEIIGVVPVGHGDGYRRVPGNEVLVAGRRAPVVGTICMDQFMVSLPEEYPVGSEVVLIGRQANEEITIQEVRNRWKSTYSGVCLVHPRVPRIYQ